MKQCLKCRNMEKLQINKSGWRQVFQLVNIEGFKGLLICDRGLHLQAPYLQFEFYEAGPLSQCLVSVPTAPMTSTIAPTVTSASSAVPTPAPLKNCGQRDSEPHRLSTNIITHVITIEQTAVIGSPTAVAQPLSSTGYAKVKPSSFIPISVFVILFITGTMIFAWKTFNARMRNFFRAKFPTKKEQNQQRQPPHIITQPSTPSFSAPGEISRAKDRQRLRTKLPKIVTRSSTPPLCANGESLSFENFAINNRSRRINPIPLKEPARCAHRREMTLLILEGKAPRPPPSPFMPLPPGIV
ncbi:hypothetical protein VP01_1355g3 [Puccinia sorghi]|uniref:Uncharacterized protein n=1 Tax=Puccinia sorghi TaxID=27349 RepID=A0A0L6VM17_9BASI|nr:hypothetical protein VP01_1355g3 [Puccinia sorghi]